MAASQQCSAAFSAPLCIHPIRLRCRGGKGPTTAAAGAVADAIVIAQAARAAKALVEAARKYVVQEAQRVAHEKALEEQQQQGEQDTATAATTSMGSLGSLTSAGLSGASVRVSGAAASVGLVNPSEGQAPGLPGSSTGQGQAAGVLEAANALGAGVSVPGLAAGSAKAAAAAATTAEAAAAALLERPLPAPHLRGRAVLTELQPDTAGTAALDALLTLISHQPKVSLSVCFASEPTPPLPGEDPDAAQGGVLGTLTLDGTAPTAAGGALQAAQENSVRAAACVAHAVPDPLLGHAGVLGAARPSSGAAHNGAAQQQQQPAQGAQGGGSASSRAHAVVGVALAWGHSQVAFLHLPDVTSLPPPFAAQHTLQPATSAAAAAGGPGTAAPQHPPQNTITSAAAAAPSSGAFASGAAQKAGVPCPSPPAPVQYLDRVWATLVRLLGSSSVTKCCFGSRQQLGALLAAYKQYHHWRAPSLAAQAAEAQVCIARSQVAGSAAAAAQQRRANAAGAATGSGSQAVGGSQALVAAVSQRGSQPARALSQQGHLNPLGRAADSQPLRAAGPAGPALAPFPPPAALSTLPGQLQLAGPYDDPQAMYWLHACIDPGQLGLKRVLSAVLPQYAVRPPPHDTPLVATACRSALAAFSLSSPLMALLSAGGLAARYRQVEAPLSLALACAAAGAPASIQCMSPAAATSRRNGPSAAATAAATPALPSVVLMLDPSSAPSHVTDAAAVAGGAAAVRIAQPGARTQGVNMGATGPSWGGAPPLTAHLTQQAQQMNPSQHPRVAPASVSPPAATTQAAAAVGFEWMECRLRELRQCVARVWGQPLDLSEPKHLDTLLVEAGLQMQQQQQRPEAATAAQGERSAPGHLA